MSTPSALTADLPLAVRVELAHAAACRLAEREGVDVLVLKGPRMDPSVAVPGRSSSDVDVLVRPAQLGRYLRALEAHGARALDSFATGSPFGHSTTLFSPVWGHIDVHRLVPGIEVDPAVAFESLWGRREQVTFGGIPGWAPQPAAQALVLGLHAARSARDGRARADVEHAWGSASPERRADIVSLVGELRAEVAWAAATGGLEAFRDRPSYRLWRAVSLGEGRVAEWRGRVAAADGLRAKVTVIARAPWVNVDHLTILLGRRPTRAEVGREFVARIVAGLNEVGGRLGPRRRPPRGRS